MYKIGKISKGTHSDIPLEVYGVPHVFNYYNFFGLLNIAERYVQNRKAHVIITGHKLRQTSILYIKRVIMGLGRKSICL
jgi:hypothetical protein